MEISVKKGLRPSQENVLSYAEEQAAKKRIQDLENEMMGREVQQGLKHDPKDLQSIEKLLNHYKTLASRQGAKRLEGRERVDAEVELRRIVARIEHKWGGRIPSYQEYWMNHRAGIQYLNLVNTIGKLMKDREYDELIKRWKALRRGLEPDDPYTDNVLHLFKY